MPDFWNPASWTFSLLHRDGSISDFYALPCWACNFVYSYKAMSSRMFLTSPVVGLPQFTHCSSLSSHWQFSSQQSLLGESFQACSSTLLFTRPDAPSQLHLPGTYYPLPRNLPPPTSAWDLSPPAQRTYHPLPKTSHSLFNYKCHLN